MQTDLSISKDS